MKPLHLSFRKHCRAPLQAVWDVLADTDRFNRAAGMGFELSELADAEGGVRRVGKVTKLGFVQLEWEEQPVLYVRPDWFRVERVFVAGPAARVLVEVHLHADATGTAIHYDVSVQPRGLLHAAVVAAELHTAARMQLDRALAAAIRVIEGAEGGYDPEAPAPPHPPRRGGCGGARGGATPGRPRRSRPRSPPVSTSGWLALTGRWARP